MEMRFGRIAKATPLHPRQLELVIGSLLGDAALLRTTAGHCFRVHHSIAQRSYVDWKHERLRNLVRSRPRCSGKGYYFRTVSHPEFAKLATHFYDGPRKVVPFSLLEEYLSPPALAVWIMHDGAADGSQLCLNTQSFTWTECEGLASFLFRRYSLKLTLNADKGKPRLRCCAESMSRLSRIVQSCMLPEMLYKLTRSIALNVSKKPYMGTTSDETRPAFLTLINKQALY
jgi:hypothetical protein